MGSALAYFDVKHFDDVETTSYYSNAVDRMVFKSVIQGYDDGLFHPNDAVNRAQAVTMLYRYDQQLQQRIDYLEDLLCNGFDANSSSNSNFTQAYTEVCEAPADYLQ